MVVFKYSIAFSTQSDRAETYLLGNLRYKLQSVVNESYLDDNLVICRSQYEGSRRGLFHGVLGSDSNDLLV